MRLDIGRIQSAITKIDPVFLNSPQYVSQELSTTLGCRLILKVETMNPVRCFKGRGVELALSSIDRGRGPDSIVCASAGNLGQALAYSGRRRNFRVTVTASSRANPSKIAQMKALGANVILVDGAIEEARETAIDFSARTGCHLIEDSKNVATCEGAGTIGLELADSDFELDAVLISLGAGAMATGVGHAVRRRRPSIEVLTVQPELAPAMTLSIRAGRAVDVAPLDTIADGVSGRYVIPEVLNDLREVVSDALLVSETSIREAMRLLYRCSGLVVEPSAALGIAAILENRDRFRGMTVATILCGGNVAVNDFERWVIRPDT